jgi:formate hydrogenlyase transcriptional activator
MKREFEDIKQSEPRLRKIIDKIPALVWCGLPDGSLEFFNQRWRDYTGLSPEEAHGWGWKVTIHPDDIEQLMDTWSIFVASGEPAEVEARIGRFDGQYRWFLFRAEPLRDEHGNVVNWCGTSTDIEDRKRAEEKLRQDETELRQITDAIAQLIMVLAPDGTALYANQTLLDFSGLSMEDVMAADFRTRFFHPEDVERLRDERRQALSMGVPFENEQRTRRKDGTYRWFLIHYNPQRNEQVSVPKIPSWR